MNVSVKENIRPCRVLLCPNAFKGSLTSRQAAQAMEDGLRRGWAKGQLETIHVELADGGDGFMDALLAATGGARQAATATGPRGNPIPTAWGRLGRARQNTAVIEMAEVAGLRLLSPADRDPRVTSTQGVGELMLHAVEAGCDTLVIGIGGSATNDGGSGMAQALGARLLDVQGRELAGGGASLASLAHIDTSVWKLPSSVQVIVACDVDNPLCGPEGASAIYGPQKGANDKTVAELDAALAHYADVLARDVGMDVRNVPGAGAGGGLGAGLLAFCHASLRSGTDMLLDLTDFNGKLAGCDLVMTGEGRLDAQTTRGKAIAGVAQRAKAKGVPVVALAGSVEEGAEEALRALGLDVVLSILQQPLPLETALSEGYRLVSESAERVARLLTLWSSVRELP